MIQLIAKVSHICSSPKNIFIPRKKTVIQKRIEKAIFVFDNIVPTLFRVWCRKLELKIKLKNILHNVTWCEVNIERVDKRYWLNYWACGLLSSWIIFVYLFIIDKKKRIKQISDFLICSFSSLEPCKDDIGHRDGSTYFSFSRVTNSDSCEAPPANFVSGDIFLPLHHINNFSTR